MNALAERITVELACCNEFPLDRFHSCRFLHCIAQQRSDAVWAQMLIDYRFHGDIDGCILSRGFVFVT